MSGLQLSALFLFLLNTLGLLLHSQLIPRGRIRAGMFCFYTNQSNLLLTVYELLLFCTGFYPGRGLWAALTDVRVSCAMALCIWVTHLIYQFVLVPYEKEVMDYNERIELIEKAREAVRYLRKRTDISFRIGFGSVGEMRDMADSYTQALRVLVESTGSVAHVDDLPLRCEYAGDYPVKLEKRLFEEIENGEINNATASAKSFFDWMMESGSGLMDIRLKVLEFVLWSEHIAYEKGGMTYQLDVRSDYLPGIMSMEDPERLRLWFTDKIAEACRNIQSKRSEKSGSVIEEAMRYIRENYNRDISLDEVSREVNISPYYFSKLFKDSTEQNFIEYLTNLRMDKAKELLLTTDSSMKEICSMVGYADPNYFSRTFKKNIGVTPTEYKENKGDTVG